MANKFIDTEIFDKAAFFAINAHHNSERRGHKTPYIIHAMEAAAVCESITSDQEVLAASILHDVVEDTDVTLEDIRREFGDRVASLVKAESVLIAEGKSDVETWKERKQESIDKLSAASYEEKIVAMGDKLSNMRAIYRDYVDIGDELWNRFHNNDPAEHEWHYRGLAIALYELKDTHAYKEFVELIFKTFEKRHLQSEHINLDEWELFGDGFTARSYYKKDDDSIMLKLYEPIMPTGDIERELRTVQAVYNCGIPCPVPGKLVSADGKYGVIFERVKGKISFARAIADNPGKIEMYAQHFAKLCKDLHSTPANTKEFVSIKDFYRGVIKNALGINEEEKARMSRFLEGVEDSATCIHGDLHQGNVLVTPEGKEFFIDLGDFAYGNPMFDLGMTYFISNFPDEKLIGRLFHCTCAQMQEFFRYFVIDYFGAGTEEEIEAAYAKMRPYAGLRMLFLGERDHSIAMLKQIFMPWFDRY